MQEPTIDPRRVGAMGTLLHRLNNITKQIQTVETIPFDTILVVDFSFKTVGFEPTIEKVIATVHEIRDLQLILYLIASFRELSLFGVKQTDDIYSFAVPVEWVQKWKPLKKDDLPLTLDYEVKYPAYNKLFQ